MLVFHLDSDQHTVRVRNILRPFIRSILNGDGNLIVYTLRKGVNSVWELLIGVSCLKNLSLQKSWNSY